MARKEFDVRWQIDVMAETAEEAVLSAIEAMPQSQHGSCSFFEVADEDGVIRQIDANDIPEVE